MQIQINPSIFVAFSDLYKGGLEMLELMELMNVYAAWLQGLYFLFY